MATADPAPAPPPPRRARTSPPLPPWLAYGPAALLGGGAVCLAAGTFFGLRRGLATAAAVDESGRAAAAVPPTLREALRDTRASALGARALLYGTLLALGGCGVLALGAAAALGARSPQDLTDILRAHGPRVRARVEGAARPAVDALAGGGRAAAAAADGSVGAALRSAVAPVRARGDDDVYAGLSKRDRKALDEFLALFGGGSGSAAGEAAPSAGGAVE
jgi:hypothetical protein